MEAQAQSPVARPKPRIPGWLIAAYVLALAAILAWPIVAFGSIFAFDAPGSAQNPGVWAGVITVLSYPVLPLIGVPASFFAYRAGRSKLAYLLAGIGGIPAALIVVFIILSIFGSVIAYIGIMLGGKF